MTNQDINKWLRLQEKQNFYIRKALENAFTVNTLQSPKKITNNRFGRGSLDYAC